jgi:hypothetical protein
MQRLILECVLRCFDDIRLGKTRRVTMIVDGVTIEVRHLVPVVTRKRA